MIAPPTSKLRNWETQKRWNPAPAPREMSSPVPLPALLAFTGVPLCYLVGQTTEWPQYRESMPRQP